MAPAPAPWAVLGDALWCLGLGCLLAAVRDALRLALGEGKLRCFLRDAAFFAAAAVLICGFAAGTSAGGLARWYMSAAVLLGALCWHWAVQPAVHRAASMLAVLLLGPLHAAHKMLLQPLVENAIIHGLSKKEEGGTVRVHIWQKDGFTLITIGDNGLGMDEAALMHLRGELEKEDGKTGIGLGNIFRRIRAMYQDGNVEIYSKKDVGTVVKIQIRHKEVGEHDVPCVGGGR